MARLRTGVDNFPAVAFRGERLDRRLHAPDNALHVDVIHLIDHLFGDIGDRRRGRDAGIVHNDVEAAQRASRLLDRLKDAIAPGDVDLQRNRLAAGAGNRLRNLLRGVGIIIGDRHGKAVFRQA